MDSIIFRIYLLKMCMYIVYHRLDLYLLLLVPFFEKKKKTNTIIPPLPSPPLPYPYPYITLYLYTTKRSHILHIQFLVK